MTQKLNVYSLSLIVDNFLVLLSNKTKQPKDTSMPLGRVA